MPMTATSNRLAFSLAEAAEALGVSRDTLRRAAAGGALRTIRLLRRVMIPEPELRRVAQDGLGFRSKAQKPK